MATTWPIGGNGTLFVGEDKTFRLELLNAEYDASGTPIPPHEGSIPTDMTGWVLLFDVRKADNSPEPAIFSKTVTITGVWNALRSANTQRGVVFLTDTELNTVKAKTYRHSWKRMDDGSETVVARGPFAPEKATAP